MLMCDMTETERETVRQMSRHYLPVGAELLELTPLLWSGWECDHDMSLIRLRDGTVRLHVVAGVAGNGDPLQMLDDRISAYKIAIDETERFRGIAKAALGLQKDDDSPWACPSCGIHFYDSQPHCPACGAEHE